MMTAHRCILRAAQFSSAAAVLSTNTAFELKCDLRVSPFAR